MGILSKLAGASTGRIPLKGERVFLDGVCDLTIVSVDTRWGHNINDPKNPTRFTIVTCASDEKVVRTRLVTKNGRVMTDGNGVSLKQPVRHRDTGEIMAKPRFLTTFVFDDTVHWVDEETDGNGGNGSWCLEGRLLSKEEKHEYQRQAQRFGLNRGRAMVPSEEQHTELRRKIREGEPLLTRDEAMAMLAAEEV